MDHAIAGRRAREAAHDALQRSEAEAAALAAHLAAVPRRLNTAANAARLAARRCSLVELKELVLESPTTTLQIDGHEIAVTLRATMPANEYGLRVDRRAYPDPLVVYSDAELAGVIAEAVGLDLSDLAQRRRAQQQAQLACRRLAAIVAYQASARLGDPNDAADYKRPVRASAAGRLPARFAWRSHRAAARPRRRTLADRRDDHRQLDRGV